MGNSCFNLLAKDALRATDADEPHERGPKVALVIDARFFAVLGGAKWLAGTTPCPDSAAGVDSGESEGFKPTGDSAEEMALGVFGEVIGINVGD